MKKINLTSAFLIAVFALPTITLVQSNFGTGSVYAQEGDAKPKRKSKRVQSIPQSLIKEFTRLSEAFDVEDYAAADRILDKIEAKEDLNNISKAYIHNYRGNIHFTRDNLRGALSEFKKVLSLKEGVPEGFYNQIIYVVAQVYFSQENYSEALKYARQWFQTQKEPTADGYMLVGQALYMLKRYDEALPNVQKGIQKYVDVGSIPKEGWLNLLTSIYRQKNDYKKNVTCS